jgi:TAT-translocated FGD2 family F420-dependent dehydrogenase
MYSSIGDSQATDSMSDAHNNIARRTLLRSAGALMVASASLGLGSNAAMAAAGKKAGATSPAPSATSHDAQLKPRRGTVGFMLGHEQFRVPDLLDFGAAAEQAGFDLLATSDHFQPWQDNEKHSGAAWSMLGALTQRTRQAWLGPTVTCPILRYHPAVVAETFATLSSLAPGRIFLGVGSGEALNEQAATGQWPRWPERWERLIEAATVIRALWSGEPVDHRGKYYRVEGKLYDPPVQPIPLLMAANGPKAMRLAGEHGDGLITDGKTWKEHKDKFEAGAKAAGKNIADMPVLVETFVVVGNQRDIDEAAQLWHFLPKAFKGYHAIPDPAQIRRRAEAEIPLQKVYAEWATGTDPAPHVKAIEELFASGATIVNVHAGQNDQRRVIEFYGREVLPQLRGRSQHTA